MSMHTNPLTYMEKRGLHAHGLPTDEPSQLSDAFRAGVAWAGHEVQSLKNELEAKVRQNAQLMRERDAYRNAEETQIALRQKLEEDQERNERLAQVEAMRHVANWLSGAIEEGCIGLDLAGEISGPTGCNDADKCRVAGERIFREAARIWEFKFVLEAKQ